jgi:hypothetical protein
MKIAIAVLVVLVIILLLRMLLAPSRSPARARKTAARARAARVTAGADAPRSSSRPGGAFRGVSLKQGPNACEQAKAIGNKRFLPGQLGQLPLAGCDSPSCTCKFVHHEDRRDMVADKRAISALRTELYHTSGKPERRSSNGRRKGDAH